MMSNRNQMLTTAGCFLAVLSLGGALLILPVRKEAKAVRAETTELQAQLENLAGTADHVAKLQAELSLARTRIAEDFKNIPSAPVADLMSRLSLQVDGEVVQDWSLAQGMPQAAVADEDNTAMVIPWTAEIKSRFDAVFDVLRVAESMNELIRVSSVRMSSTDGRQSTGRGAPVDSGRGPMVTAAIVFESVYDPQAVKEQR